MTDFRKVMDSVKALEKRFDAVRARKDSKYLVSGYHRNKPKMTASITHETRLSDPDKILSEVRNANGWFIPTKVVRKIEES